MASRGPQGLDQIGPSIAEGHRHGRPLQGDAEAFRRRNHNGGLNGPLAAARGHKEVHQPGTEEGEVLAVALLTDTASPELTIMPIMPA